jgi:transcriptional regulator with XRE-family HTH domain
MTQADLADELGMSQQAISKLEKGLIELTVDRALEIAELLNTSADRLLPLPDHSCKRISGEDELLQHYRNMPEAARHHMLNMAALMSNIPAKIQGRNKIVTVDEALDKVGRV